MILWQEPRFIQSLDSTQDYLLNHQPPLLNTVVYTDVQKKGRGTHQRVWTSDKGDLIFSFRLRHTHQESFLVMVLSLSLIDILKAPLTLKPPNDLLIDLQKCGGILIEQTPLHESHLTTIGIGINLTPKKAPFGWLSPHQSTLEYIHAFETSFNQHLAMDERALLKRYHAAIDWDHLKVFYQEKQVTIKHLRADFICETNQGPIPMAHLSFEIF